MSCCDTTAKINNKRCSGIRMHQLSGVFLRGIRRHFSRPGNLEDLELRRAAEETDQYIWHGADNGYSVTSEKSQLLIESAYVWERAREMNRPAIIVARGAQQNQNNKLSVFDDSVTHYGGFPEDALPEAGIQHVKLKSGRHIVTVAATSAEAVELLLTETERLLSQTAPIWRVECGFEELQVDELTDMQLLPEAAQFFASRIVLSYSYLDRWTVSAVEPRFAGVKTDVR